MNSGTFGVGGTSGVSGTSGFSPWRDKYCPNCGSGKGRYDSDLTQFHQKDNICSECDYRCYSEELLTKEQSINKTRFEKLNDILDE